MRGFLLDTSAISMFAPSGHAASDVFADWVAQQEAQDAVYLSTVTIHELEKGVRLLEAKGKTAKAAGLETWLRGLMLGFGDRILPVDSDVALAGGELEAKAIAAGHNPGAADAMIAGTARVHHLSVITQNVRHFKAFGIPTFTASEIAT